MDMPYLSIITRDRGPEACTEYAAYQITSPDVIVETAKRTLSSIPPAFGSCVMMSAGFVAALKSQGVPAVVILGDLLINGQYAFKCRGSIPGATYDGEIVNATWDGHAWVLVGGVICDLSIFRTAYAIQQPSNLKAFVTRHFGAGKGALMSPPESLPPGMEFVPQFALKDDQIYGLLEGLSYQAQDRDR